MAFHGNWMRHNLMDRLQDHSAAFKLSYDPVPYEEMSFAEATEHTIRKIQEIGKPIYLGYSGGMDSEYVFKSLIRHDVEFTAVIVITPGNSLESAYALHECRMHGITPVILERSAADMLNVYYHEIFKKLNGYGLHAAAGLIVGRYAEEHGGVMLMSEHLIDEKAGRMTVGANEWDFYNDVLIGDHNTVYFFLHTPEICTAVVREMDDSDAQEFKHRLYGVPFRPKIHYDYGPEFDSIVRTIAKTRKSRPDPNQPFGSKEEFLSAWAKTVIATPH